jgi:hypothetical protein
LLRAYARKVWAKAVKVLKNKSKCVTMTKLQPKMLLSLKKCSKVTKKIIDKISSTSCSTDLGFSPKCQLAKSKS